MGGGCPPGTRGGGGGWGGSVGYPTTSGARSPGCAPPAATPYPEGPVLLHLKFDLHLPWTSVFTSALKATWILSPRTSCTSPMPKDGCWITSSAAYVSFAEYLRARDKSLPARSASQLVTEGFASRRSRTSRGSQEPFRGSAPAGPREFCSPWHGFPRTRNGLSPIILREGVA